MNWLTREIQKAPRWLKMFALLVWVILFALLALLQLAPGFRERAVALSGIFIASSAQVQQPSEIVVLINPVESVKVSVALGADDRWTKVTARWASTASVA